MRVLILLALLGAAAAFPRNIGRIVGGNETNIETYPFMTNMQFDLWGIIWLQGCGGSLITPNTVVTAAHCVEFDQPSDWRCVFGSSLRNGTGGNFHSIVNITIHPEYEVVTALDADVAILHLASRVQLSDRINTIAIASRDTLLPAGLPVTTIGWGTLTYQGASPVVLQHVHVNIINQEWCARQYAELKTRPGFSGWPDITPYMACAGVPEGGKDGCQGDSGGPVIYRGVNLNILVGITSWGYECARADHPGVVARVPPFTDWIVANAI